MMKKFLWILFLIFLSIITAIISERTIMKIYNNSESLIPPLTLEKQSKAVCSWCGFDHNPEITHSQDITHGACAVCYENTCNKYGLKMNQELYEKGLLRMQRANAMREMMRSV